MSGEVELFLLFTGLGFLILAIAVILVVLRFTIRQKSYLYRKYLVNMYVAGRIKQLAKKEDVDLDQQELDYLKYDKLSKKDMIKDLDDRIEGEMSEEIESTGKK